MSIFSLNILFDPFFNQLHFQSFKTFQPFFVVCVWQWMGVERGYSILLMILNDLSLFLSRFCRLGKTLGGHGRGD